MDVAQTGRFGLCKRNCGRIDFADPRNKRRTWRNRSERVKKRKNDSLRQTPRMRKKRMAWRQRRRNNRRKCHEWTRSHIRCPRRQPPTLTKRVTRNEVHRNIRCLPTTRMEDGNTRPYHRHRCRRRRRRCGYGRCSVAGHRYLPRSRPKTSPSLSIFEKVE